MVHITLMQLPSIPTWGVRGVSNMGNITFYSHIFMGINIFCHIGDAKASLAQHSVILFQLLCSNLTEALECCSGAAGALLQGSWRKLLRGFCNENLC